MTVPGNASQLTDGAAAVIMARRSFARKHNLPVLGIFRAFSVVGVDPTIMGVGPAYAIPAVLKRTGTRRSNLFLTLPSADIVPLYFTHPYIIFEYIRTYHPTLVYYHKRLSYEQNLANIGSGYLNSYETNCKAPHKNIYICSL